MGYTLCFVMLAWRSCSDCPDGVCVSAIYETLKHYFGFDHFRTGQGRVVEAAVQGRSAAAIFPTGSGKSLCYQLSALHLPHLTLVVSPLLALMKDQLEFLHSKGIKAASVDSTQSREQAQEVMAQVRSGEIKILMISVERLKNERFRRFIAGVPISMLVVDEAHCISEWGHNFRPDYIKLPAYQREFAIPQVMLLTATATPQVVEDMQQRFGIAAEDVVVTGFYRANLNLLVKPCAEASKRKALLASFQKTAQGVIEAPSIVYVTLQQTAHLVADFLLSQGIKAEPYHAGLKTEDREAIQARFMSGQTPCVVATIAFGMGIDKSDIRRVIHYDLPKSIENYSQEIGRAGRDGQASDCVVLANREGVNVLENFVYGDTPELSSIKQVLAQIQQAGEASQEGGAQWEFILNRLSGDTNIRPLPLKTLLVYLEVAGLVKPLYSYYADYRFKLDVTEAELYSRFKGERAEFLQAVLQHSQKARIWYTADFERLNQAYPVNAQTLGVYRQLRERAVAALEYCHEQNLLTLESKQMTEVYSVFDAGCDLDALALDLFRQFETKQSSEVARIAHMLSLFESQRCLTMQLSEYFGDHQLTAPCGHCSVCGGYIAVLPETNLAQPLSSFDPHELCSGLIAKAGRSDKLSIDLLTRYLCGITSPYLTQLKARSLGAFAVLEAYRYADVRAWLIAAAILPYT
jgi:ATP-dependent DNA helicase RecQ